MSCPMLSDDGAAGCCAVLFGPSSGALVYAFDPAVVHQSWMLALGDVQYEMQVGGVRFNLGGSVAGGGDGLCHCA